MLHGAAARFDRPQDIPFSAALEHLADESAAGGEHLRGELPGSFGQADNAQVIGLAVASAGFVMWPTEQLRADVANLDSELSN